MHFVKYVSVPLHYHILPIGVQDVWAGKAATKRFHKVIARLLADIRRERPAEATFAAHLLDIVDPCTGQGITDEFLQPEIALLFLAGFESARPLFVPTPAVQEHAWLCCLFWQHAFLQDCSSSCLALRVRAPGPSAQGLWVGLGLNPKP